VTAPTTFRELAHRRTDGIDVSLRWWPGADRLSVRVADAEADAVFEFEVGAGDDPLDAFHHPFAFAAGRGGTTAHRVPDYGMSRV
jgi:hypothetical protein